MSIAREDALALDAADPLAHLRDRFLHRAEEPIYLDGNSLGRLPLATAERLARVVRAEWGAGLIESWQAGWLGLPRASATCWRAMSWAPRTARCWWPTPPA